MFSLPNPLLETVTDQANITLLNRVIDNQDFVVQRFRLSQCRYRLQHESDGSDIPDDQAERRFAITPIFDEIISSPSHWSNDGKNSLRIPSLPNSYYMNTYLAFRPECEALSRILQAYNIQGYLISGPGVVVERDLSLNVRLIDSVDNIKNEFNAACVRISKIRDINDQLEAIFRQAGNIDENDFDYYDEDIPRLRTLKDRFVNVLQRRGFTVKEVENNTVELTYDATQPLDNVQGALFEIEQEMNLVESNAIGVRPGMK